nr:CUB domain-containing protein-like [Crassostrea gigas]
MTEKGFHLTWRVFLPQTKALPTQKMLATTTKYKVRHASKEMDVKTTVLQLETTTPTPSQVVNNILQYEDGITGQITSPGYPGRYPNNVNYTWIIRTESQSANVAFRIIEMNINRWWYCDDYLELF